MRLPNDRFSTSGFRPSPREDIGATRKLIGSIDARKKGCAMPLRFNQLLEAYGIPPREVRLLRHQARSETGRTPYILWRDERALFDAYQAAQQVKNRTRLAAPLWASFVVPPDGRTMFAGLYSVNAPTKLPDDWPYPLSVRQEGDDADELYSLDRVEIFKEFEGRLYIEWGTGTRTWVHRPEQQDKPIVELSSTFEEPTFPGFSAFCEPLSRIASLPSTWTAALTAARGI